eukprot:TRINITY_DN5584_c0_g1_i1.p1 TRINITY_DN5584_c0_g1~~TRINITY_DN5584_c0_g1_i1.p1  ORF type:complete len:396 (+),score=141.17 TRINITY_DN5584_c0_g1_i1:759-1946(+)
MQSRGEAEFFGSEEAVHHWARELRPDALVYGFTMAHVAMIVSESLGIPMVGFLLQPQVLRSGEYQAVLDIKDRSAVGRCIADLESSHSTQSLLRIVMEDLPVLQPEHLSSIRHRRGLARIAGGSSWFIIAEQNSPIVIPINEACFGGRPADWPSCTTFTDFVFLRWPSMVLPDAYPAFIRATRAAGHPLVFMAFSSMPVPREEILEIACLIIERCTPPPAVIAMVGDHTARDPLPPTLQRRCEEWARKGRLLEGTAAPFALLLPEMDVNIIHGGMGTTSEALKAGKPVIVTGFLLMDQRFWGHQAHRLGVGPPCVHISEFDRHCVQWVSEALVPGCPWAERAAAVARGLSPSDGIAENAEAVARFVATARPIDTRGVRTGQYLASIVAPLLPRKA